MDDVDVLRRFNRSYTQRIGVLSESYLGSGRPLGPSRVVFEVGSGPPAGTRVGELRRRLTLDSGYFSRLLRVLEHDGLVTVEVDPEDRRQRVVRLTADGRREWRRLDRRSDDVAHRLVDPLTPRQRAELAGALATAERLLRVSAIEFDTVDPDLPEARQALDDYFAELDARFPTGFDPGDDDVSPLRQPDGAFVVVRSDSETIGCGGLQRVEDATAEIKRMWIHPGSRGLGLGPRLLAHLEQMARDQGRSRVVLDTNATLVEALAMYERAGYRTIERYNDNPYAQRWFAKSL